MGVISKHPPNDTNVIEWGCQCARCGGSVDYEDCWQCGGEGVDHHDCGEDCCCCAFPEDNVQCDNCMGEGGWRVCGNSSEWCEAHPLPGREQTDRGLIEWYAVERKEPSQ